MGRVRQLTGLALAAALAACQTHAIAPGHSVPANPYARQFEEYWYRFDRRYPYFDYKHVDWQAAYDRYRPQAEQIDSEENLVTLLKQMTAPLRDVHVWFTSPDGREIPSYEPERAKHPNWSWQALRSRVTDLHTFEDKSWGYGHVDGVPYIYIAVWERNNLSGPEFGEVLDRFRDASGLILDVRMNGGGKERPITRIAGYFTGHEYTFGYFRFRNGPGHGDFGDAHPQVVKPTGRSPFTRPVALLIGPDCFSSNESFIAAMQALPNVTSFGDVTGGGSGCPRTYALGEGWHYSVPTCFNTTADGHAIEWNGLDPDVPVAMDANDLRHLTDPVLDRALAWLKGNLGTAH